jgi:hypothetical protein
MWLLENIKSQMRLTSFLVGSAALQDHLLRVMVPKSSVSLCMLLCYLVAGPGEDSWTWRKNTTVQPFYAS